jgi:hypothetical protein
MLVAAALDLVQCDASADGASTRRLIATRLNLTSVIFDTADPPCRRSLERPDADAGVVAGEPAHRSFIRRAAVDDRPAVSVIVTVTL